MLRLARVSVRSLSHTRILASGPAPFNNLPGSFLNGEDGRTMEKVADIGPPAAEEVLFLEFAKIYIYFFRLTSHTSITTTIRSHSTMPLLIAIICALSHQMPDSLISSTENNFPLFILKNDRVTYDWLVTVVSV